MYGPEGLRLAGRVLGVGGRVALREHHAVRVAVAGAGVLHDGGRHGRVDGGGVYFFWN